MFGRILVAVEASAASSWALGVAIQLAERLGSQLALVHVVDITLAYPPEGGVLPSAALLESLREEGSAVIARLGAMIPADLPWASFIREGAPVPKNGGLN